ASLTIADVNQMSFTTPLAHDVLSVTLNSDGLPQVSGQSDALQLLPVAMLNVANLTLDTVAHDGAGNAHDTVTFDARPDRVRADQESVQRRRADALDGPGDHEQHRGE